jgi:hypothetical protein
MIDQHEDIGWPSEEEEAAMDRAAEKSQGFAAARTPEEIARMRAASAEATAYRLAKEARQAAGFGDSSD